MTRALDLFAGAGGWDLAAHAVGIEADGVEWMPEAQLTRDAAGIATVARNVWTVPASILGDYTGLITSPPCQTFSSAGGGTGRDALADVLSLIPTVATSTREDLKAHGRDLGDERTALVLSPLWYALHMPAVEWTVWEQVPPVLPVWEACATVLEAAGWHVWTGVLSSEQYGVPQTRRRAVLIASRTRPVGCPAPTHSRYYSTDPGRLDEGLPKWVSMAEALGWGMTERPYVTVVTGTENGGTDPQVLGGTGARRVVSSEKEAGRWVHQSSDHPAAMVAGGVAGEGRPRDVDAPSPPLTGKGTAAWVDEEGARAYYRSSNQAGATVRHVEHPAPTVAFGNAAADVRWHAEKPPTRAELEGRVNNQSGGTFDLDDQLGQPASTVAGRDLVPFRGANANRFNDSTKSRNDGIRVTVAEAGVLQSFPATYPWQGGKSTQYLQAGNAVPPLMARAVLAEATGRPNVGAIRVPERAEAFDLFDLL